MSDLDAFPASGKLLPPKPVFSEPILYMGILRLPSAAWFPSDPEFDNTEESGRVLVRKMEEYRDLAMRQLEEAQARGTVLEIPPKWHDLAEAWHNERLGETQVRTIGARLEEIWGERGWLNIQSYLEGICALAPYFPHLGEFRRTLALMLFIACAERFPQDGVVVSSDVFARHLAQRATSPARN